MVTVTVERRTEELVILLHVIKDFGDQEEEGRRKKKEEKIKRLRYVN